ncbi:MAG: phage baseplate assembly protein V [Synergistaceae bacterium]|jgi:hypothetical protein|nr:phage baseplate assembly protein V [Synergistaceae bacterium]
MGLELAGKHRGIVVDNADPEKLGRLKVRVESAYGEQPAENLPWAWPCFLGGGSSDCGCFYVPEKGAVVWVEFLWSSGEPDPSSPVWTGVWFTKGGTPAEVEGPPEDAHHYKVLKTTSGHKMVCCDKPGEECVRIHGAKGQTIEMDENGGMTVTVPGLLLFRVGHTTMRRY